MNIKWSGGNSKLCWTIETKIIQIRQIKAEAKEKVQVLAKDGEW